MYRGLKCAGYVMVIEVCQKQANMPVNHVKEVALKQRSVARSTYRISVGSAMAMGSTFKRVPTVLAKGISIKTKKTKSWYHKGFTINSY